MYTYIFIGKSCDNVIGKVIVFQEKNNYLIGLFFSATPGCCRSIAVTPDTVWVPDVILKNNADSNAVTVQKGTDKVWVKYNGRCSWYPKVMMISSFRADVRYFPFDDQKVRS